MLQGQRQELRDESTIAAEGRAEADALQQAIGAGRAAGLPGLESDKIAAGLGPEERQRFIAELGEALRQLGLKREGQEQLSERRFKRGEAELDRAALLERAQTTAGGRRDRIQPFVDEEGNMKLLNLDTREVSDVEGGAGLNRPGAERQISPAMRKQAEDVVATQVIAEVEASGTKEAKKKLQKARLNMEMGGASRLQALQEVGLISVEEGAEQTARWLGVMTQRAGAEAENVEAQMAESSSNIKRLEAMTELVTGALARLDQ